MIPLASLGLEPARAWVFVPRMHHWVWMCLWIAAGVIVRSAETNFADVAVQAWKKGEHTNALALVTKGLAANPKDARLWNMRAHMKSLRGMRDEAIQDLTEAIKLEPDSAPLWQERAKLRFRLNRMEDAVVDFDRAVSLRPEAEPYNWERGIAQYYAGKFAEGRRQFETHQTVNSNDVENAVWHFLCVARAKGLDEARKNLIPIQGDTRVPMKEVHQLFAGKLTVKEVLAAAEKGSANAGDLSRQRFYAHLYLGLYYEALGEAPKVREHILAAVQLAETADYMGDVARVHAQRLDAPKPGK